MQSDKDSPDDYSRVLEEIYTNEMRFHIIMLLQVYNELSLTELAEKVGRTKPTVHHHLQKMLELGVVIESREETVRGSIPAKFYSLSKQERNLPGVMFSWVIGTDDSKVRFHRLNIFLGALKSISHRFLTSFGLSEYYIKFIEQEADRGEQNIDYTMLEQFHKENPSYWQYHLLSDEQFEEYEEIYDDFNNKIKTLKEKQSSSGDTNDKSHLILVTTLPIRKILDLKQELK